MKILLGSKEFLKSKDKDFEIRLDLTDSKMMYDDYIINKIVDEAVQFNKERNESYKYQIYGKVETLCDDALSYDLFIVNETNYNITPGYIAFYEPLDTGRIKIQNIINNTFYVNLTDQVFKNDVIILYKSTTDFYIVKVLDTIIDTTTKQFVIDKTLKINKNDYKCLINYKLFCGGINNCI